MTDCEARAPVDRRRPEPCARPRRVLVAADLGLVTESVRAALSSRGLESLALRWPSGVATGWLRPRRFDVGLVISELDRASRVWAARALLDHVPVPWIVLTDATRGPTWGAVLESGAVVVLPSATSLDEVIALLGRVGAGEGSMPSGEREDLVGEWLEFRAAQESMRTRVGSLTPREWEVLRHLYSGDSVGVIASLFDVSQATVRTQVKAILRKLGVNSQLAAVAAVRQLQRFRDGSLTRG